MAVQGDPQPGGPFPVPEPKPSRGHTCGGFESPQRLWKEQRVKVSAAAREARAAPPVKARRGRLLPGSGAALSGPKESSFPGASWIPQATRIDLTWFYRRAVQLLRATPIPRWLGLNTGRMSTAV